MQRRQSTKWEYLLHDSPTRLLTLGCNIHSIPPALFSVHQIGTLSESGTWEYLIKFLRQTRTINITPSCNQKVEITKNSENGWTGLLFLLGRMNFFLSDQERDQEKCFGRSFRWDYYGSITRRGTQAGLSRATLCLHLTI